MKQCKVKLYYSGLTSKINLPSFLIGIEIVSEKISTGIFLFSQIIVGIIGNSSILLYYVILKFTGQHLMPKDLIIEHLTFPVACLSSQKLPIDYKIMNIKISYITLDVN